MADGQNRKNWLTIIGVGDNGLASISGEARQCFDQAETIIAPARVLNVIDAKDIGTRQTIPWTFGVSETIAFIKERRGTPTLIMATGNPMHFGIGATLRRFFEADEMLVLPSPSGFSLAAAKMGWAVQDVASISLHGRAVSGIHPHILPSAKIISLTSVARTIYEVADILVARHYGASEMTVLEHIGGGQEKISTLTAREIASNRPDFADFNMLAVECVADKDSALLPPIAGLPDDAFIHDGQLTKREIRAVTLSHLAPIPHGVLWDIGAGCGSISIEWMRSARGAKAFAIERDQTRLAMIEQNAIALGTPRLKIIEGNAPGALADLPKPNAVFIGGGLTTDQQFETCWAALKSGGRLVANAVTVESESKIFALAEAHGGELTRMQVARTVPVGRFKGWKPSMPVTIWSVTKPYDGDDTGDQNGR